MSHQRKAAIDCRGYRCEMDGFVDLSLAGFVDHVEGQRFNELQDKQQDMWDEFRDWYMARHQHDDDDDD